jgi:transcription elongation GreA/GreB family factor
MNNEHNQIDNADICVLRSRRAELQQAQGETNDDIQAGDDFQQYEGRIQQRMLTREIQAVEDQIQEMNTLLSDGPGSQADTISIGHVITIRIDGGDTRAYVLVNERGGQELSGKTTLSSQTPVGNALIGRRISETVSVGVGEEQITIEIMDVGVLT